MLEQFDVSCVVAELVTKRGFSDVVLWGRGTGALAAAKYARRAAAARSPVAGASKRARESSSWSVFGGGSQSFYSSQSAVEAYPDTLTVSVDVLESCGDDLDEAARVAAAGDFLDGLTTQPLTYAWVLAKPQLVVTNVRAGSKAHQHGLKVDDLVAGVGTSMMLPHSHDELFLRPAFSKTRQGANHF